MEGRPLSELFGLAWDPRPMRWPHIVLTEGRAQVRVSNDRIPTTVWSCHSEEGPNGGPPSRTSRDEQFGNSILGHSRRAQQPLQVGRGRTACCTEQPVSG